MITSLFPAARAVTRWAIVLLLSTLFVPTLQTAPTRAAGVIYVNAAATGAATGTSWSNAFPTLQSALATATAGSELWVARGIYYPDAGAAQTNNSPQSTFRLANDVALYGGFVGTETTRTARNVATNVTVLSGDLQQNDTTKDANGVVTNLSGLNGTNAHHVVTGASGATSTTILDGFTITAGWADTPFNGSNQRGGGMYNENSSPTLTNVTFAANRAAAGGGMYNAGSSPTLISVIFTANTAQEGGGMYNIYSSPLLTTVTFAANSTNQRGGGMYNANSSLTLTTVTFAANTASLGGGMYNYDSRLKLTNVTFDSNTAKDGGGMYNIYSSPTLTTVTFASNTANNYGGGMLNIRSNPTLTNVTFASNSASTGGGGMINDYLSSSTLTNVTFAANSATQGGGMYNDGGNATLTNITFAANSATQGGGMYNDGGSPTLRNVTFAANSATQFGGGMYNAASTPTLTNVIIAYSPSGGDCVGSVNAASAHNLIMDSTNRCGLTNGSNGTIIGKDPRLGPLQNNGGATRTHALLPTSPAIDAGTTTGCPTTDQRDIRRPQGDACDIGAVEYPDVTPISVTVEQAPTQADPTKSSPIVFSVTFDKPVVGFDRADVRLAGTAGATFATVSDSDNGSTYTISVWGMKTFGTVSVSIVAGAAEDTAGKTNTASTSSDNTVVYVPTQITGIIYVNAAATGAATGTSWSNAFPTLQDALAYATVSDAGNEIWVARGVYYPDAGTAQTNDAPQSTFRLAKGVALYGGFVGTETSRTARNVTTNVTVLSGDLEQNDTAKDPNGVLTNTTGLTGTNAYHVVTVAPGATSTAILDGFTITAGWANGDNLDWAGGGLFNLNSINPILTNMTFSANRAAAGGGMYNEGSNPTLTNVTFTANHVSFAGGGMDSVDGNPTLSNVTFAANRADSIGGGISNRNSNPVLTNVTFSTNTANYGGGISNRNSNPVLTNVTFSTNTGNYGGGVANIDTSSPMLTNVTFDANSASTGGGGMFNSYSSSPMLTNVTFDANSASTGGGMFNEISSNPTLTNVTFASNEASFGGGMYNAGSTPTLTNVIIAYSPNGGDCTGFVNAASAHNLIMDSTDTCGLTNGSNGNLVGHDPRLGPLQNNGGTTLTHALLAGSPAINAGTNTGCPATDQRGIARPYVTICDIGAVEYKQIVYLPIVRRP